MKYVELLFEVEIIRRWQERQASGDRFREPDPNAIRTWGRIHRKTGSSGACVAVRAPDSVDASNKLLTSPRLHAVPSPLPCVEGDFVPLLSLSGMKAIYQGVPVPPWKEDSVCRTVGPPRTPQGMEASSGWPCFLSPVYLRNETKRSFCFM